MSHKFRYFLFLFLIFLPLYLLRLTHPGKPGKTPNLPLANKLRFQIEQIYQKSLLEPQASLLSGIVLGSKKTLPKIFYQALQTTGTLHLVVASGMNVSLTAGLLLEILAKLLGRKPASLASLLVIVFYCFMAGFSPPIVRASLMAAVIYLAAFFGREGDSLWILILSAMMMLIIIPQLIGNVGFQLSFSATLGIIVLNPVLTKKLSRLRLAREEVVQTLSAQFFTLPILVVAFGHFNPLSLIPNLLVLWLVPYLMVFGLIIGFAGLIFYPLALFLSWLSYLPLTYFVSVINFFGQFKVLDLKLTSLSWLFGLGYYLILVSLLTKKTQKTPLED